MTNPRELVVISGKGGTGKTSVLCSFAILAENAVIGDCDVDAANVHLILQPVTMQQAPFYAGAAPEIDPERCTGCGECVLACRFGGIALKGQGGRAAISAFGCEGCGVCEIVCPANAITMVPDACGLSYQSRSRAGPMAHARLHPGAENSGKLVAEVREQARNLAQQHGASLILIDGPPGVGCPVIASLTGADHVLIVTEPTVAGAHDLDRVLKLAAHFKVPASVCINKWDLSPELCISLEKRASQAGARLAGRIRYAPEITHAQRAGKAVVEYDTGGAASDIRAVWEQVYTYLMT